MTSHIRRFPLPGLWAALWLIALAVPYLPYPALALALPPLLLSTVRLAPGRPQGRRLILAAAGFWAFWSLLMLLAHLILRPTGLRPTLNLAVWLNLGLILVLARTPLELARSAAILFSPLLGRPRAQKLALTLALLTRLIPALLASALTFRAVLGRRAASLPLTRRLNLWGRNLLRDTLGQSEDLSRTMAKRWPW
ncbi:MAG: hypothetical protein LBC90_01860 [Candidatus Adiutrix sp.]|nr:hypothetical protein [Candidatus Adiutrix sp.]